MPTYVYVCDNNHELEQIRKIKDRDKLTICGTCRRPMERDVAAFRGAVYAPTSTSGGLKT